MGNGVRVAVAGENRRLLARIGLRLPALRARRVSQELQRILGTTTSC